MVVSRRYKVVGRGYQVVGTRSWVAGRPKKTQRVYGVFNKSLRVVSEQGVG